MPPTRSLRRRQRLVLGLIALVLVGLAIAAFLRPRKPAVTVQTEKVERRNLTETVVANGRIQPVQQVKISAEVSGEIIELLVKEGQPVNRGDVLVRIRPDLYLANVKSAEAGYQSAVASLANSQATLRRADLEFQRNQQLFGDQLISELDFLAIQTSRDIAHAQSEVAGHQVEVARAALDRTREELAKTTITAPLAGTVSQLNSKLGERVVGTAMMTGTEILIIADLDQMEARVDIGEIDIVLVQAGQTAQLEVDAFRDRQFHGTVTEIANSAKSTPGQSQEAIKFEVRIRITDKEPFRPGMSVSAEIQTRSRTNVLTVPIQSVTTRLPKPAATNEPPAAPPDPASSTNTPPAPDGPPKPIEVVFVVHDDQVRQTPVRRGISDNLHTEIIEGLEEGWEIVSGGYRAISRDLEDGLRIQRGPAARPGAPTTGPEPRP